MSQQLTRPRTPAQPAPSLAGRALFAVLLFVGFYVLALAIVGVLLFIPYAEMKFAHRLHGQLLVGCVLSALAILWSILPRVDRFVDPGPRLTADKHPRLFQQITEVAAATGQAMPSEVYLVSDVNAWVMQRGGVMGFGSRRVMGLGLPLLQVLSVEQLRAVLAHEFGHYHGGDTQLGPWIYKTRSAIERTIQNLGDSVTQIPFRWYGSMFLRITHAISRAQEYTADALAARVAGPRALADGLRAIHAAAPAYAAYWKNEVGPVLNSGHRPPLASGFRQFIQVSSIATAMEAHVQEELHAGKEDPYDTHPPLRERIAAVEKLGLADQADQTPSALTLLNQVPELEVQLLAALANARVAHALQAVDWAQVGEQAYLPQWRRLVSQQPGLVDGLTVDTLPEAVARRKDLAQRLLAQPEKDGEGGEQRILAVLGAAFAIALHTAGWTISALPGEEVLLQRDGASLAPFGLVQQIAGGYLAGEAWRAQAASLGIDMLSLSAPAEAAASK